MRISLKLVTMVFLSLVGIVAEASVGLSTLRSNLLEDRKAKLQPERLALMLSSLKAKRAQKSANVNSRIMALQREVTDAEDRLKRLYGLVEDGMTDLDDVLKQRIDRLKADRDRAKAALDVTKASGWGGNPHRPSSD